jgi:hypothetical protein
MESLRHARLRNAVLDARFLADGFNGQVVFNEAALFVHG